MAKEKISLKELLNSVIGEGHEMVAKLYGGMMNLSYVVKDKNDKLYVVYVPNGKSNELVNRYVEKDNTEILASLGLTGKMIYFDTRLGIKIKEYIEGESLNKTYNYDIQKVADLLHCIHDSDQLAPNDYAPFDRLADYENQALKYAPERNDYRRLKDFLSININHLLNKHKVFSHNDFQKSNIVKGFDEKYYVIDFEFCGNNDEVYDIAAFANDNLAEGERLLEAYFNNDVPASARRRFYLWRIFISLQWHTLAIVKHYQNEGKNTGINFLSVATHFIAIAEEAQAKFLKLPPKKK